MPKSRKTSIIDLRELNLTPMIKKILGLLLRKMVKNDWKNSANSPVYTWDSDELQEQFGENIDILSDRMKQAVKGGVAINKRLAEKKRGVDYVQLFNEVSFKSGTLTIVPNDLLREEYIASLDD